MKTSKISLKNKSREEVEKILKGLSFKRASRLVGKLSKTAQMVLMVS